MAKLVLVFLVVCCLVQVNIFFMQFFFYRFCDNKIINKLQLIIAARITRDTSTETKPSVDLDSLLASGKKSFDEFFTKDNLDVNII